MTKNIEIRKVALSLLQILPLKTVAIQLKVSISSIYSWIKLKELNPARIRKNKLEIYMKYHIRDYVLRRVNFNYKLLLKWIDTKFKIQISKSTLYAIIKKFNLTRKKIYNRPLYKTKKEQNKAKTRLKNLMKFVNKQNIISIDETSIDTHIRTTRGWSLKGKRISKHITEQRIRYTMICAISNKEIIKYKMIKGSANGEDFLTFIKELNITEYNRIFLDNARIHHYTKLKEYIKENSKYNFIYNVPYSPQYNPIEYMFSELKAKLRKQIINKKNILKHTNKIMLNMNKNLDAYFNKSLDDIRNKK
jgi:transposase